MADKNVVTEKLWDKKLWLGYIIKIEEKINMLLSIIAKSRA